MKMFALFITLASLFSSLAMADSFRVADRASYIITLNSNLSEQELDACMADICSLSGNRKVMECEIVSKRARIAAATLSNSAARKVGNLGCVKSLRAERFDFEPRPRTGRSN